MHESDRCNGRILCLAIIRIDFDLYEFDIAIDRIDFGLHRRSD